jgi:hypothetical protein
MQIFQHKTEDEPEGKVIPAYQSAQVMAIVCVIPRVAAERALHRPSGAGKSTLLALVALLFGCGTLSGCRDRIYLSTGQVEARIGKEIPPGSSEEQVRAFVNSYNPQFEAKLSDYEERVPEKPERCAPDEKLPQAQGYVWGGIPKTGIAPRHVATLNIRLCFYFDKNRALVAHKVKQEEDY